MRQNNPILSSALIVFSFWWIFFTLRDFVWSPFEVVRNWSFIGWSMRLWVIGAVVGIAAGAWLIWFKRIRIEERLCGAATGRMLSTLGKPPQPLAAPERVQDAKKRLPLNHPKVSAWRARAAEACPEHLALFDAVWDIYSAHRDWPASHRLGGHGNRRLWEHCLAVVVTALDLAPDWKFDGVYVKTRGHSRKLIIAPSRPDFEFNGEDPLIPILALAHDIGKLEAFARQADGSFNSSECGSTRDHDDVGVVHDTLGARILARLPEFWALPPGDRRILSLVIAHYHHPSSFPVDRDGLSLDDRMTSLLEFLILVDRKTGMEESGITAADEANEITDDESKLLWRAFVEIVTEHGRINGIHGDSKSDKGFMIGSKHGQLVVIQEQPLRTLLLAKLGQSVEIGDARYRITRNLLTILAEKGLLYDQHNGIDFSRYAPMWEVSHRRTQDGGQICSWRPCIIIRDLPSCSELDLLATLAQKKARLRVELPLYTHNPNIRDPEALRELVRQAFGEKVAEGLRIPTSRSVAAQAAEDGPAAVQPPVAAAVGSVLAAEEPTALASTPMATEQGQGVAPWDDIEPDMPEGIALSDLPDPSGDGLDGIDVDLDASSDGVDCKDDFGDFEVFPEPTAAAAPAAQDVTTEAAPAPVTCPPAAAPAPAEAAVIQGPRDAALVAQLQGKIAGGSPIRDADAPKVREVGKSQKDKDALKALRAFSADGPDALSRLATQPKGRRGLNIEEVRAVFDSGRIEIAGERDGCRWALGDDLRRELGRKWTNRSTSDLGLKTMTAPGGHEFVGLPNS